MFIPRHDHQDGGSIVLSHSFAATGANLKSGGGSMDLGGSADGFKLAIGSFSTTPTYLGFYSYTTSDPARYFISKNTGSVHVAVSATPVPAALPLFVSAPLLFPVRAANRKMRTWNEMLSAAPAGIANSCRARESADAADAISIARIQPSLARSAQIF
jgi:hypothetical protein